LKKLLFVLGLLLLAPLAVVAEETAYTEGVHYDLISPALRGRDPGKIEIVEFFWYGCGHCYNFEPLLVQWKKTFPEDVDFMPSPAMWNPAMKIHAQAFYTAQALGVLDPVHGALFAAMNVDRKRLASYKSGSSCRTAVLSVTIGEQNAIIGDAVDVRRVISDNDRSPALILRDQIVTYRKGYEIRSFAGEIGASEPEGSQQPTHRNDR